MSDRSIEAERFVSRLSFNGCRSSQVTATFSTLGKCRALTSEEFAHGQNVASAPEKTISLTRESQTRFRYARHAELVWFQAQYFRGLIAAKSCELDRRSFA
jgi:hypothetical protein